MKDRKPPCSKRAVAAPGKPFQKGEDPRRHKFGRESLDRAAFSAKLNNFLCNGIGDPKELAQILWGYARRGQAWAVSEILDRICGRVPQALQIEPVPGIYRIVYAGEFTAEEIERAAKEGQLPENFEKRSNPAAYPLGAQMEKPNGRL